MVTNNKGIIKAKSMRTARKDDRGQLSEDVSKQEAIDFLNKRYYPNVLPSEYIFFSNINHTVDAWLIEIPLQRIETETMEENIHILLYDYRSHNIHHLEVPISFIRENEVLCSKRHHTVLA